MSRTPPAGQRGLAQGDFERLNQLLDGVVIQLPDAKVSTSLITLKMINPKCTSLRIDDFSFVAESVTRKSFRETSVKIDIEGLDMVCYLDYKYTFLFTNRGSAALYTYDNHASISMAFQPPNFNKLDKTFHLSTSDVKQCDPKVNVADVDFKGGISAWVLDTVERLMRNRLEAEAEKRICEELQSLSKTFIADLLKQVDDVLALYPPHMLLDPLVSEQELDVPTAVDVVDLLDKSTVAAKWADRLLADAVEWVTKEVDDSITGRGSEMNLNVLLRQHLLTEERALLVDASDMVLFQRHDRFIETEIVLGSVKVFGLDKLNVFEPLVEIGRYTLQNELSWSSLTVEMDVTIDIKPSTKGDSVFARDTVSTEGVQENVKIKFGLENVYAVVSTLLAIDEGKLGGLHLGSLMDTESIVDCILSTIYGVEVSGLLLEVGDIQPPMVEGFLSRGIDRVVSNSVDAAFQMYESTLLEAAPGFFHDYIRKFLNKKFLHAFQAGGVNSRKCSQLEVAAISDGGYLDFRDFLLPPDQARAAGGQGTQPYGDVVHTFVSQFKEQFLESDLDGSPKINSVIRTTLAESFNVTDAGVHVGAVYNWNSTFSLAGLEAVAGVKVLDARIENLDSFGSPLELLQSVTGEPHMLNNTASIGVSPKPVRLAATLLLTVSDNADLQLRNEVAVSLDLGTARIALVLLLHILEKPFFSVPLEDTLNLNCWLTTILPNSSDVQSSLLVHHAFSVEKLHLNISCASCSNPDFDDLVNQLYSPDGSGNATSKVANFLGLLRAGDYLRFTTDEFLRSASRQCPHHSDYDPTFSFGEYFVQTGGGLGFTKRIRDKKAMYFNVANAVLLVCLILSFVCVRFASKRRCHAWKESLTSEALGRLYRREAREREREAELNETTNSMYRSRHLPRHIRLLVPFTLVATVGIQLGGHLGVLSTVNIEGQIAGGPFAVRNFLEFSFIRATIRSYNNGGSEMAILLFMFTGLWPYVKLLTSLALWFAPPRMISVSRRAAIFLWLDVFAKLSVVDIFTTLIAVAAFLVFSGGVDERMTAEGQFFSTRLIVVPGAGFYCLIIAQRITRISSRYLLDCHHQLIASATQEWIQKHHSMRTHSADESWETIDDADRRGPETPNNRHDEDEVTSNAVLVQTKSQMLVPEARRGSSKVGNESSHLVRNLWHRFATAASEWQLTRHSFTLLTTRSLDTNDDTAIVLGSRNNDSTDDEVASNAGPAIQSHCWSRNKSNHETMVNSFWGRVAIGLTGLTVLIIGIVGCVLAPSISLDTKTVWGLFESGQTFEAAVKDYPVFRVICAILVQSRFVLNSAKAKVGLGFLLVLVVVTATAFPAMNTIVFLRRWNRTRRTNHVVIRQTFLEYAEKLCSAVHGWCNTFQRGTKPNTRFDSDLDLLPAYRHKAWEHLEVYMIAFVIACWQLGAVASYSIHQYCQILERAFDSLVFLGLVEKTSAQCFREQASSPSSLLIICLAFVVLLVSFLFQATGQYRKVMVAAVKQMRDTEVC